MKPLRGVFLPRNGSQSKQIPSKKCFSAGMVARISLNTARAGMVAGISRA
jgi:hypothetical protein